MPVAAPTESAPAPKVAHPVVIKMGRQRSKRIRQLRKGTGKLLQKVMDAIAHLQSNGTVLPDAQPVVVVVKEEPDGLRLFKK